MYAHIEFKSFADDTQFYMTLSNMMNIEENVSVIMDDVSKWMASKHLKLNEDKTKCMIVSKTNEVLRQNGNLILNLNGIPIETQRVVKNLGVLLDHNLSFKDQIHHVVRLAGYHLKNIAFIKKYLDKRTLKMLVHNYVISRLDYCNSLYYGLPNYILKKLQNIMNRAARLIDGLPPRDRITPVLINLHWLPIKARIVFKICVLTHQALKLGKPGYIQATLRSFSVNTNLTLRHATDEHRLNEPRYNTQLAFRAYEKCAPRLYNKLPIEIKNCKTLASFKKKLKTYLFSESYDIMDKTIKTSYRC